jgi:hypothetical protein
MAEKEKDVLTGVIKSDSKRGILMGGGVRKLPTSSKVKNPLASSQGGSGKSESKKK